MKSHNISPLGQVYLSDGNLFSETEIDVTLIAVEHLHPHVETFQLDANSHVKVLIQYSCHCWTCGWDDTLHGEQTRFLDHAQPRAFDPTRFNASINLSNLMRGLPQNRIFITQSDRNYGCYNATLADDDGHFYTAYFTVRMKKGKFDGIRHKFVLFVESAYTKTQQEPGMKTSFRAVIGKAREGKMVKYRS
ncbi:MAG: hypothetical protein COA52_14495 [Hyphomicrobiales bacterium]|nr:MAG: hypothetical protein COA52_14495 [Hyphomicrobiales bacterium]